MKIPFFKFHGTGNDFVLIDNRSDFFGGTLPPQQWVAAVCHRRFGVGADGLILLQNKPDFDFQMVYFNADGGLGSMCGNGGRCAVALAHRLGIIGEQTQFLASDGAHQALVKNDGSIELKMQNVSSFERIAAHTYFLQTGSPHYVEVVENLNEVPVVEWGRAIRYNDRFKSEGTNVNFVQINANGAASVATYERGVEDETYSCGTGVTASAIVYTLEKALKDKDLRLSFATKGGDLQVQLRQETPQQFSDIWLCGPAVYVFEGFLAY